MDTLENAVRNVEFFMHLPMPVRMVSVLFADSVDPSYTGNNSGTGIVIKPEYENDMENLPQTLTHEIAHYYWSGNRDWIDEGMSALIQNYHRWQTTGTAMTPSNYPCPHAPNIQELERVNPNKQEDAFSCNYSLGERLFIDLWNEMGEVPFRTKAQKLYHRSEAGTEELGIADVKATFNNSPAVSWWYSNQNPKTGTKTQETAPTWRLDEIHGTITEAGVTLSQEGPTVKSFSADSHTGPAYFHFHYNHPPFVEENWTVNLIMTETFEDGFIYGVRPLELKVKGTNIGGSWHLSTGPGPRQRWKPGAHRAMLHDWTGNNVAEVRWTVTP